MTRADHISVPPSASDNRPTLLRWNDYLTGRSCALRVADSDVGRPLRDLTAQYLTKADPTRLANDGMILRESVSSLMDVQDVVHAISDQAALNGVVPGTIFRSGVRELWPQEVPPLGAARVGDSEVGLIDLTIDRSETGYSRNWTGFNRRRWERSESQFRSFVENVVRMSCGTGSDAILELGSRESRIKFLTILAKSIWDSPFENYSRFTGRRFRYKTGDEALTSIIEGYGAICSEKVQALKFVSDQYGFESHYVLAGPDTPGLIPIDRLRHILDTFDFRGAGPAMRYWQHMALEFVVDGERILVDATNGNIPFLFMSGPRVEDMLNEERPQPVSIRMGTYPEKFYYHRAPRDLSIDLCYAMENFIPEIDLVQVFDNELGLTITPEYLVSPLPYRSDADFGSLRELYQGLAEPQGLAFDIDSRWQLDGPVGTLFSEAEPAAAELVMDSFEHLRHRYNQFEDDRHNLGLAVIRLVTDR